jgi:broad specificity phosphatase PhoE
VSARLTLVAHASTAATSRAAFGDGEGLERRGAVAAASAANALRRVNRAVCSPAPAAVETAAALGLSPTPNPALGDWFLGDWRGRTLDEVVADAPAAAATWLADPDAAPHGGETLSALVARVAEWLAGQDGEGHTVAVTHAAVVRAAVIATLGAPATGFWRIDVAPLTATVLRGGPIRWTVRRSGLPLDAVGTGRRPGR